MTPATTTSPAGPLYQHLPPPRNPADLRALEQLKGHTTSEDWLPVGLAPELDEKRAEMLRLRANVAEGLEHLAALDRQTRNEDKEHEAKLRQAARDGSLAPVDERDPGAVHADRQTTEEAVWAFVHVMAEVAEATVALIAAKEDEWVGGLRGEFADAQAKRIEAERLLVEAQAVEWQVSLTAKWLTATADDIGIFGRQPAPTGKEPVPPQFSRQLAEQSFERHWTRARPEVLPEPHSSTTVAVPS